MHERDKFLNYEILNEVVGSLFTSCHEHSLQGYFEEQYDRVIVEVQCEQQYQDKKITKIFEDCPRFYDRVSKYMEQHCHGRCTT